MKSAAIVTIKDAASMTKKGRKAVANWLRKKASCLEQNGQLYSRRFVARYLYN